ncbi:MAG: M28 family peptidase [Thermoplasmata archaeon]|nr:M28 family peptidase [Thermoplasmata archaeon]
MRSKLLAIVIGAIMIAVVVLPIVQAAPPLGQGSKRNLTSTETALVDSLDIDNAMYQLEMITKMGEKIAGDSAELAGQQYIYDRMSEMPLDNVVMESFPTVSWSHEGDTVMIISPTVVEIPCAVYGYSYGIWGDWMGKKYSFGNQNGGKTLVAPVVDVGLGTTEVYDTIGDLNGAIALVYRDDDIQMWPNVMNEEAALNGASAIISYGYYGGIVHPDGIKQDVVGGQLPFFSISLNSANQIKDLLAKGEVVLSLEGKADAVSYSKGESVNVAGYMYGTTYPDEYVVFGGHIDCWWNGTSDDSSSVAAVLEFARMFSEAREAGIFSNERTLVFTSVGAEEFGGPADTWYDWLIGSYEFVMAHPEIMEGLVVDLNMDGVSFKKTSGQYWLENTWEINDFVAKSVKDLGKTGQISYYNPIWSWTDAWSFGAKGGGSTAQAWWTAGYDPIYHTQIDDWDLADTEPLTNILQLYTLMGARADHSIVMPFNFMPTVDWAAGYLSSEEFALPYEAEWFDMANAALDELRDQVSAVNAYAAQLQSAYAMAKSNGERKTLRAMADDLNRAMIDARRIITPWTIAEGGTMGSWDVFLRSDQHAHDLMYIDSAIAALQRDKGRVNNAMKALESVYTMEWGHLFSPETYETVMGWMINDEMYWGDDFDQQQMYVDVHWIYMGLKDKSLSVNDAIDALNDIKNTQLIPWLEEDLVALAWAWGEASMVLDAAVP